MESANWEQIQFSPAKQLAENEYKLYSKTCPMLNPVGSHCSERGASGGERSSGSRLRPTHSSSNAGEAALILFAEYLI